MKHCTYVVLFLSILLWLEHCQIGFLHAASFCHNGKILCSLFIIKVACASIGVVFGFVMFRNLRNLCSVLLLSIFVLSALMDIAFWIYSSNRDDDDSPKAMIIFPGGFTIEATDGISRK